MRPWCSGLDGSYLELCECLPGLCEISRTGFKHPLEFLVERGHPSGRHAGNRGGGGRVCVQLGLGNFKVIGIREDA